MRRYETICILDPDLSEEGRVPVFEKVNTLIPQGGGFLVEQDEWGSRKLAYEIHKKLRGFYVRFDFCGDGSIVNEMERFFRIDDRIMKYMTVLLEEDADPDQIKAAMEKEAKDREIRAAANKSAVSTTEVAAAESEIAAPEAPTTPDAPTPEDASAPDSEEKEVE